MCSFQPLSLKIFESCVEPGQFVIKSINFLSHQTLDIDGLIKIPVHIIWFIDTVSIVVKCRSRH